MGRVSHNGATLIIFMLPAHPRRQVHTKNICLPCERPLSWHAPTPAPQGRAPPRNSVPRSSAPPHNSAPPLLPRDHASPCHASPFLIVPSPRVRASRPAPQCRASLQFWSVRGPGAEEQSGVSHACTRGPSWGRAGWGRGGGPHALRRTQNMGEGGRERGIKRGTFPKDGKVGYANELLTCALDSAHISLGPDPDSGIADKPGVALTLQAGVTGAQQAAAT